MRPFKLNKKRKLIEDFENYWNLLAENKIWKKLGY
jgi:hypothetical protein